MTFVIATQIFSAACFGFALFSLGRCIEILRATREINDITEAALRAK